MRVEVKVMMSAGFWLVQIPQKSDLSSNLSSKTCQNTTSCNSVTRYIVILSFYGSPTGVFFSNIHVYHSCLKEWSLFTAGGRWNSENRSYSKCAPLKASTLYVFVPTPNLCTEILLPLRDHTYLYVC